jgi:hypothetical protein
VWGSLTKGGSVKLRRKLGLAAACVAALPVVLIPSAVAAPATDSASGHITIFGFKLDFSARSASNGVGATGSARVTLTISDPNQVYSGEVTCLRVVGATATTPALAVVGVKLTRVPPGATDQSLIINASDSGKFGQAPDTATTLFSSTPPPPDGFCPAPVPGQPVADGEIVIQNTLP